MHLQDHQFVSDIKFYFLNETVDLSKVTMVKRKSSEYTIVGGYLYKRGISSPLLKCLRKEEAAYILLEVHKGIIGQHLGVRALAKKILREEYLWPTMV